MEVVIDRNNCGGCQLCADACPEVFEIRDGHPVLLTDVVPSAFRSDCRYACEICPTQSISIEDWGDPL